MPTEREHFLDSIKAEMKLSPSSEREILHELATHFEERVEELKGEGLSEEEAAERAAQYLGSAKAIAKELNQVHNPSDWAHAIIAALPHLLFASLFAFHQWSNIALLLVMLAFIIVVAVYGWWRNKPSWFFPWLGYALIPLLAVGFILAILIGQALSLLPAGNPPSWWVWIATLVYIPIILWFLISLTVQTLQRDWLLGSLMALPFTVLAGWLLALEQQGWSPEKGIQLVYESETWIALSFLFLAGAVILFIRLRERPLKAGALLAAGVAILALVIPSSQGSLGLLSLLILTSVILALLFVPALLRGYASLVIERLHLLASHRKDK